MTIFTIIVTYNAMQRGWIDRCLKSLAESTAPTTAIVIDNGSTDGTREHVPSHYPDAIWMPQEKNLGFGQANNIGIKYALEHNADYVLLLNQDAAIAPDALEKMLAVSDGESLLSPLHLNGDGSRIDEMFRISIAKARNTMLDDLLIGKSLVSCYETGGVCAACWLMPADLLRRIGGFNPLFFHYGEDDNYCHRMAFHRVKTLFVPKAKMFHDRVVQGNMQAFNHKRLRRDMLIEACNINQGFLKSLLRLGKVLANCYLTRLSAHQYRVGAFTAELTWMLLHAGSIQASRKKEKKTASTWLSV